MTTAENATENNKKVEKYYINNFMKNLVNFSNKSVQSTEKVAVFEQSLLNKYIQGYFESIFVGQTEIFDKKNDIIKEEMKKYIDSFIKENKLTPYEKQVLNKTIKIKMPKAQKNESDDVSKYILNTLIEKSIDGYDNKITKAKEENATQNKDFKCQMEFTDTVAFDEEYDKILCKFYNLSLKITKDICKNILATLLKTPKGTSYEIYFSDNANEENKIKRFIIKNKDNFNKIINEFVNKQIDNVNKTEVPTGENKKKLQFTINKSTIANLTSVYQSILDYKKTENKPTIFSLQKLMQCMNEKLKEAGVSRISQYVTYQCIQEYLPNIISQLINLMQLPQKSTFEEKLKCLIDNNDILKNIKIEIITSEKPARKVTPKAPKEEKTTVEENDKSKKETKKRAKKQKADNIVQNVEE